MKKLGKYVIPVLALILLIAAVVLVVLPVSKIVGGALNTVLGIVVVVALVLIVLWMFSYAKRKK
jgi:hypothetical protein